MVVLAGGGGVHALGVFSSCQAYAREAFVCCRRVLS